MKEVTVGVYHQGCWGSGSAEKFPGSIATIRGPLIINRTPEGLAEINNTFDVKFSDNKERDDYLRYIRGHPLIRNIYALHKTNARAILSFKWKGTSSYASVMESEISYTGPIVQENGFEKHTVLAKNPNALKKLLGGLDIIGEAKVFKVSKIQNTENPHSLTEKQAKALRVARAMGYYSWPRKVGLEEMARASDCSRRAFQENLRKAEAKVIPNMLNKDFGI